MVLELVGDVNLTACFALLPVRIVASLAADGMLTLRVNDEPTVTGKAPGFILR